MRRILVAAAAAVLVIGGALAVQRFGGGGTTTTQDAFSGALPVSGAEASPTTPVLTGDVPVGDPDRCDGVELTGARPVTDPAAVAGLTLCWSAIVYRPGLGYWSTWETGAVPGDRVPGVAAVLPVVPYDGMCSAIAYMVPTVTVTLDDGSRFVAAVPNGACDGGEQASAALNQTAREITPVVTVLEEILSQRALDTGCGPTKALYPTTTGGAVAPSPPAVLLSACVFRTDSAGDTSLQTAGPADPALVRRLLDGLAATPPTGCAPPGSDDAVGDFVSVVATPPPVAAGTAPPYPDAAWLFSVGTDDCHIAVDWGHQTLGWADPADVAALVAATS